MGKFKLVKQMFSLAVLNCSLTFFFLKPSAICNPHYYCCFVKNMWFQESKNRIAPKGLQLMAEGHTAALLFVHRWITWNASSSSMFKQTTSRSNWLFNCFYFCIVSTLSFPGFLPVFTGPAGTGFVLPLRNPEELVSIIISQTNNFFMAWMAIHVIIFKYYHNLYIPFHNHVLPRKITQYFSWKANPIFSSVS